MKLQISIIPEFMVDVLTLIIVISFVFGIWILYSEFKVTIISNESEREIVNFAEVLKGDKCILAENTKGIFDYQKIKENRFCIEKKRSFSFIIEKEIIDFGCRKSIYSYAVLVKKGNELITSKLLVC
ncbi:MAG: hypothetical protein QXQ14_00090 [Candidatus Aenigmatarchaeota archaeon]